MILGVVWAGPADRRLSLRVLLHHRNCRVADQVDDDVLSAIRCPPSHAQNATFSVVLEGPAHRCRAGVSAAGAEWVNWFSNAGCTSLSLWLDTLSQGAL